ncbi:disulfide bond formation protein B [Iodidimonas sp. SYSU 1G8]|uniref:disulfide bond formation protein B n=1 Tax=Iodidimonas sp. SYSU 1G8 TaxID=3133967 RepID=UPI0031FF2160
MRPSATSSITGPVFLLLACLAMILGAYGFQYIGGLAPCKLCYWQRYAYYVAIPLAALATAMATRGGLSAARIPLLLTGLALLAGMGIAGYHAGVEYHWWPGPDTCSVPDLSGPGNILDAVMRQGLVRCDETPWSLLGISMAGYNFLISGLLALVAFRLAVKGR